MRPWTLGALSVLVAAAALLAYSVASGESTAYLVLIFPVVSVQGVAGLAGIALLGVGMLLGFLAMARSFAAVAPEPRTGPVAPPAGAPAAPPRQKSFGGVVFLGPIPIVFGSNAKVSKAMLVAGIVLTVILIAFFFLVLGT